MTLEEKTEKYESVRREYQEKVQGRMSETELLRLNEALLSAHSCAIEGNSFTVDDTRALMELDLGMTMPAGKKVYELLEMRDHLRAYEYVAANLQCPLDETFLKEVNRLVTEHTLSYNAPDAVPGEYTTVDMAAGDTIFGRHEELVARVPQLLEKTEQAIQGETHPMIVASRFHGYFEYLHPFRDGNGRTGRLISNYILMPVVALATCLLIGWAVKPDLVLDEVTRNGEKFHRRGLYKVMVRFVAPALIIVILLMSFGII